MKKVFLIAAIAVASFSVKAQDGSGNTGLKFGVGVNLGIPVSNLDGASIGAGIDLLGQYGLSEQFAITVDAGYTNIFAKDDGLDLSLIPIRGGIRFYATPALYFGAKAGVGIAKTKGFDGVTTTAYSFGGGYKLDDKFDVGATYDGYSKNGSFGLINIRLGYTFGN
ncbi:MAG: hypothetical protein EOO13_03600 [Chitinophagaceae bacterium]|nr:MAG: hypothetical protein EOO13_03600 [Chitinophagaceae bacterium]